ncbi:unnamed protein product [Penicillium viridicatum]
MDNLEKHAASSDNADQANGEILDLHGSYTKEEEKAVLRKIELGYFTITSRVLRPSLAVRVPGSPSGASQSSASQSGASHTSVGPGHAQGSEVSVASTVTSVPTILTAAADVDYVVPSRTADEQIVNESLMNLLKTLTMRIPSVACRWSSGRRPFNAVSFGDNRLVAYTDGYLVAPHTLEVFAIVEVKAMIRDREQHPGVLWQEPAEMIAWIMSGVNSRQCPLEQ